uniref:ABC transporter domain-containing protein n=1 Tax=Attheya septentrionalis TaxID=420275 RepID=A0A7S2UQH5_9STRA
MIDEGVSSHVFTLSNMNFEVASGQILAVVGAVGSGKSTLCNAIVGEVTASPESQISCRGKLAFASQIPFILSTSFRENILFGLPYEESRYEQVLDACCLRPDIEQIGGAGDLTEIGERGVTLSGGQKQRVSLARVAYSQPRIAIFDDPLSALDAGTSKMVFERLFKGSGNSLLSNSAIVLVTHASHYLHKVDNILILANGKQGFLGSWKELNEFECEDKATRASIDNIRSAVQEGSDTVETRNENDLPAEISGENTDTYKLDSQKAIETSGELMTVENREHGLASRRTWFLWFKHAGGLPFVFCQIILLALDRIAYVATEWWLAQWTKAHDSPITVFGVDFPAQTDGVSAQYRYLKVYAIILLISSIATFLRSEWAVSGGARAASSLFTKMTTRVLYAPMSYFDTTPQGRVLNRFTYDVEMLDVNLTDAMSVVMIALSWFVAGLCVMCAILPWIILALVPVTTVYAMVQLHYRKSGADLQRLDAVSRSPVQAMLAEGLNGASTIRVFQQEKTFLHRFQSIADLNSSAQLNFLSAQRWIGIRIELLGSIIVLVACTVVAVFNDFLSIEPGLVALLIIWSSNFTITLGFLVDNVAEAEAAITSVERIHAMSELPQEKDMITAEENIPDPSWPTTGALEFDNVCVRYRPGLPLTLNCCSFKVPPGKRCGIVGRTGSGKSTALVALFRLVEVESGKIVLDGVDLSKLGLQDVRGRPNGMAIIPQDPVLFAGSLRQCVDPFGTSTDEAIMKALFEVHLIGSNGNHAALNQYVEEGGSNYSVGERQLLCLARAIISTPKVLVMDEATASLDGPTDDLIQNMLRTRFTETTLLTVAHRLNTIMDYDFVLVMDAGRAVEFGSPASLLDIKEGVFSELVDATGEESAASLRAMAKKLS